MNLPDKYVEILSKVDSIYNLKKYEVIESLSPFGDNVDKDNIISLEYAIYCLAGMGRDSFSIENIDKNKLYSHIQDRFVDSNQFFLIVLGVADFCIKYELKKFNELEQSLDDWFSKLESNISSIDMYSFSCVSIFLKKYLGILKSSSGNRFDEKLSKVFDLLHKVKTYDSVFTILTNEELLNFFNREDAEKIIRHFFILLREELEKLSDCEISNSLDSNKYLFRFFINNIKYCKKKQLHELKKELSSYIIDTYLSNLKIKGKESFVKFGTLNELLSIVEYHESHHSVKNDILLKVIEASQEFYNYMMQHQRRINYEFSDEINNKIDLSIKEYRKLSIYDTLNSLAYKLFSLFKKEEKINEEFLLRQIATKIEFDANGIIKGIANDNESYLFDNAKFHIYFYAQITSLLLRELINDPTKYNELLEIELFYSSDDKHIKRALQYFIDKDYYGFVSSSIPLIEKKLRLILRSLGEADIKVNNIGGFDFRPMSAFMSSERVFNFFKNDTQFVLKAIFDDRRGFNLRNKVAHGIIEADEIDFFHAVLVLLTLVFLSSLEV